MKREAIDIIEKIRLDPFIKDPCYLYDNYFRQILECLGWSDNLKNQIFHLTDKKTAKFPLGILHKNESPYLGLVVTYQDILPEISQLRNNFIDLNWEMRKIIELLRENYGLKYGVFTDTKITYLYNLKNEEVLLYTNSLDDFELKFLPGMKRKFIESGNIEKFPVRTPDLWGKELKFWMLQWHNKFSEYYKIPKPTLNLFFLRLFVITLLSKAFSNEKKSIFEFGYEKIRSSNAKSENIEIADYAKLPEIFQSFLNEYSIVICRYDQELDRLFLRTVNIEKVLRKLIEDFLLLSCSKFTIPALISAFDCEESAQDYVFAEFNKVKPSRIKFIPTTDDYHPFYHISIEQDGYIEIVNAFDEAMINYELHNSWVERESALNRHMSVQLDIFVNNVVSMDEKGIITDFVKKFVESNCYIDVQNDNESYTSMLVLYIKMIEWYQNHKDYVRKFPDVYKVFQKKY